MGFFLSIPLPHSSGSPTTPANAHFLLQNLGTKLSLDTLFFLSAGWQNNMCRVIIPVMLKYKYLSMIGKLHAKVTIFQG